MSDDVIVGFHGKPRCAWAGAADTAFGRYHDEVWGTRTYDAPAMFEALTLGVFEVGLSWSCSANGTRSGPPSTTSMWPGVAAMTDGEIDELVGDQSIIRNRRKIQATVGNAQAFLSARLDLAELARSYAAAREQSPQGLADLPASTPQSEELARQLKSQGYRFVGPTSVYAFMQNVGVVNDHLHGCFRATDYGDKARGRL
jgi:DNA-3-methyladenine glycosylase I